MLVSVDALLQYRAAIRHGDNGPYVWGSFERLVTDCNVASALGRTAVDRPYRHLVAVSNRLTDLRTSAMKLDWMLERRDVGELDPMAWMLFAASDVNSFLTNVRSLFDHLARALHSTAPQPGGIPSFSFTDLRKWALREGLGQAAQIGRDVLDLIVSCDWFEKLRELRDEILHHDARTLVFPSQAGIAVQVYGSARILIDEPALLATENLAQFERLASATMAQIHVLLEHSAEAMSAAVPLYESVREGQSYHGGLGTLVRWTDSYLAVLT